jgi:two-component system, chemotaxis family, protein-glutamate methylesterase/glutaminase
MKPSIKVLVVDDSAFARKVLRECLTADGIEVVGIAHDGLEALELIETLKPDVVTLDLVMPNLDGLGVLRALNGRLSPKVVVVSMSDGDTELGIAALEAGAFELVHKPTALAISELYAISARLIEVVRAASDARPRVAQLAVPVPSSTVSSHRGLLVIGTSTGGPQALTHLVSALPASFPLPIAIVLHIPPGYTAALAQRLDEICALEVLEASEGMVLQQGRVVIAKAGRHLKVARRAGQLSCLLDLYPLDSPHRPSVDCLFNSAADVVGAGAVAVVLTGMGHDGLIGSKAIRAAGGTVITEAASSCVIYGMPRVVKEAGLASAEVPLERMVTEVIRFL